MRVVDSTSRKKVVYRRRKCKSCGLIIKTIEIIDTTGRANVALTMKSQRKRK